MPNTPNDWKTVAKIHDDPERAAFWREVLGGDEVPIRSFVPSWDNLEGLGVELVYYLDLKVITPEQRQKLIKALAEKFGHDVEFVAANLDTYQVPVLANNVIVTSTDQGLFLSAVGDDLGILDAMRFDEEYGSGGDYDPDDEWFYGRDWGE